MLSKDELDGAGCDGFHEFALNGRLWEDACLDGVVFALDELAAVFGDAGVG